METRLQGLVELFGGNAYVHAAVVLAASLVVARLVDWTISRGLRSWAKRTATDLDDRLIGLIHKPVFLSVLLMGVWLALTRLELPGGLPGKLRQGIQTVALIVWAVFLFRASSLVLGVLSRLEGRYTAIQPRTVSLFDQISKILIAGGSVYLLVHIWGGDVGGILAAGGIIGIAVGFAAKDTLANLFSGIFIVADSPYKLGDFIVLDSGERGRVTQIGLRSTRLLTRDDVEITIPNAVIANAKIINESGGPWEKERIRARVGVAYGSDIDRVRQVLEEIAHAHPDIDTEPAPRVRFRAFGDSGLELELLGWIHEPVLRGRVLDALYTEIYKRFAAEGIEIPYPKRDIYLHSTSPPREE